MAASSMYAATLVAPKDERRPVPRVHRWCIVTPQCHAEGGVIGTHTFLLAQAFAAAGDDVELWVPPGAPVPPIHGVRVRTLPSAFGLDALRVLRRAIRALPAETRVLVQYAPTAFSARGVNLAFALMLALESRRGIEVYFHGGGVNLQPWPGLRQAALALCQRLMTMLVVRSARRVYVTIPEWKRHLRRLGVHESDRGRIVTWVPLSSSVPDRADPAQVREIRTMLALTGGETLVGHFGSYHAYHRGVLPPVIERVLDAGHTRTMLLIGEGGGAVRATVCAARPDLAARIVATEQVTDASVSAYLAACDALLQPYEDGASARYTSLMASLALGCPVVTNLGAHTGPLWTTRHSVYLTHSDSPDDLAEAVTTLLDDPSLRALLRTEGRRLHDEWFAIARSAARLRNTEAQNGSAG